MYLTLFNYCRLLLFAGSTTVLSRLVQALLCFSPLDDEEQMEYISRYFCVRPLNNFGELFHIGVFTGKITEATKNNKFALFELSTQL